MPRAFPPKSPPQCTSVSEHVVTSKYVEARLTTRDKGWKETVYSRTLTSFVVRLSHVHLFPVSPLPIHPSFSQAFLFPKSLTLQRFKSGAPEDASSDGKGERTYPCPGGLGEELDPTVEQGFDRDCSQLGIPCSESFQNFFRVTWRIQKLWCCRL